MNNAYGTKDQKDFDVAKWPRKGLKFSDIKMSYHLLDGLLHLEANKWLI